MGSADRLKFIENSTGIREITSLTLTIAAPLRSIEPQRILERGVQLARQELMAFLEIGFDRGRCTQIVDFCPHLLFFFQLD
jgi:hypothetical protein